LYEDPFDYFRGVGNCTNGRIAGLFSIFSLKSFTLTSLFYGLFALFGTWCMYKVSSDLYPKAKHYLAGAAMLIPSVLFWGTGVLKEAFSIGCLGLIYYCLYFGFIKRQRILYHIFVLVPAFFLILQMKPYILAAFILPFSIWTLYMSSSFIKSTFLRIVLFGALIFVIAPKINKSFRDFTATSTDSKIRSLNPEKALAAAADLAESIEGKMAGSHVDFGKLDPSVLGIVKFIPISLGAVLIRPFVWEVSNVPMLMNFLEAFTVLCLLVFLLTKYGLINLFKRIFSDGHLTAVFFYILIMSFMVTATTNNYGSLVRYKTPLLPFVGILFGYLLYTIQIKLSFKK
jgi:hypothetical protein